MDDPGCSLPLHPLFFLTLYIHYLHQYYWEDGTVYDGYFKNGLRSGVGEIEYGDGSRYIGHWKNNKREGTQGVSFEPSCLLPGVTTLTTTSLLNLVLLFDQEWALSLILMGPVTKVPLKMMRSIRERKNSQMGREQPINRANYKRSNQEEEHETLEAKEVANGRAAFSFGFHAKKYQDIRFGMISSHVWLPLPFGCKVFSFV